MTEKLNDLEIVKKFITQMNEQDNRCTASPYYFSIRTTVWKASYHEDEYERLTAYSYEDGDSICHGETLEELCSALIENEYISKSDISDEDGEELSDYEIKSMLEDKHITLFAEVKDCEYKGVFFTESDAKNHLKANYYHYSDDADTYVDHCWRAPELEQFFKSVGVICGVEFGSK